MAFSTPVALDDGESDEEGAARVRGYVALPIPIPSSRALVPVSISTPVVEPSSPPALPSLPSLPLSPAPPGKSLVPDLGPLPEVDLSRMGEHELRAHIKVLRRRLAKKRSAVRDYYRKRDGLIGALNEAATPKTFNTIKSLFVLCAGFTEQEVKEAEKGAAELMAKAERQDALIQQGLAIFDKPEEPTFEQAPIHVSNKAAISQIGQLGKAYGLGRRTWSYIFDVTKPENAASRVDPKTGNVWRSPPMVTRKTHEQVEAARKRWADFCEVSWIRSEAVRQTKHEPERQAIHDAVSHLNLVALPPPVTDVPIVPLPSPLDIKRTPLIPVMLGAVKVGQR